jgi:pyridoxamine 5'-phosphate oxidase
MIDPIALAALRQEYSRHELSRSTVRDDPFEQFAVWFDEAVKAEIGEPNAMHLGTSSREGNPSGRTVLLKGFSAEGFTFYTNYKSTKARQLEANPNCYLHFFWRELERQVFIGGTATRTDAAESDEYFSTRPYQSQIGAWASLQSSVIASRDELERKFVELKGQFPEGSVPRPEFWGGFRIKPDTFEFWQGRPSRLHDRILYKWSGAQWEISRLSP